MVLWFQQLKVKIVKWFPEIIDFTIANDGARAGDGSLSLITWQFGDKAVSFLQKFIITFAEFIKCIFVSIYHVFVFSCKGKWSFFQLFFLKLLIFESVLE